MLCKYLKHTNTHACTHAQTYTHWHIHGQTYMHTCKHVNIHTYTKTYRTYMSTYITHTCTYTHYSYTPFSVITQSVWWLPWLLIWSIASLTLSTISIQHSSDPYSLLSDDTASELIGKTRCSRGPGWMVTCRDGKIYLLTSIKTLCLRLTLCSLRVLIKDVKKDPFCNKEVCKSRTSIALQAAG